MATPLITRDELKARLDSGDPVTVVEALPEMHYADKHLPGAVRIDFERVAEQAPSLLPDKDAEIVVYCSNTACKNSGIAANHLIALGYANVSKYAEGKQDWEAAGLPLESGVPAAR